METSKQLIDLVEKLLSQMGIAGVVTVQERPGTFVVHVETEDSELLIGKTGETLDAFQAIIRLMSHRNLDLGETRLLVDVNSYRRQREEDLLTFVNEVANRVKETGTAETLRPMSSYERHLVHEVISQMEGLATESTGLGAERRITVRPT